MIQRWLWYRRHRKCDLRYSYNQDRVFCMDHSEEDVEPRVFT